MAHQQQTGSEWYPGQVWSSGEELNWLEERPCAAKNPVVNSAAKIRVTFFIVLKFRVSN